MTLYITSVRVQGVVTTVLANTGPVVNLHSIAYGHNVIPGKAFDPVGT